MAERELNDQEPGRMRWESAHDKWLADSPWLSEWDDAALAEIRRAFNAGWNSRSEDVDVLAKQLRALRRQLRGSEA
jgi:hypothetical protein